MRRVSLKRQAQLKEYKELRIEFLTLNPICMVCNRHDATEIHHTNGRTGLRLLDTNYFMAVDRPCHIYIHSNPIEARGEGWLK